MSVTTQSLYTQVVDLIQKKATTTSYGAIKANKTSYSNAELSSLVSTANTDDVLSAISALLANVIEPRIISGLEVIATAVPSASVKVKAGTGTGGGKYYKLKADITLFVPMSRDRTVNYVNLYSTGVKVESKPTTTGLILAKIISGAYSTVIKDTKDEDGNAYIQSYKTYNLYGINDRFEEDTVSLLRDNIGEILADNLIGNLRLSENLKITNTTGSLELDSSSVKIYSSGDNLVAKFNDKGTYFYDDTGRLIAKFSVDGATIGNISVSPSNIRSRNFASGVSGFSIEDSGYAEFGDVKIRGRISSSVFEYDKVSAVGGKLIVSNASVLAKTILPTDTTIEVEDALFSIGDILLIKSGADQEYFEITDAESGSGVYTVNRDLASGYTVFPTWDKGTAIISTGKNDDTSGAILGGYISLDSTSQYAPFIDILYRNSGVYNDVSTKVRLGNLAGINDAEFGQLSGFGLYADNAYIKGLIQASIICGSTISGSTISAGTITGACIQTGLSNPRTAFDAYSIASYDATGNKTLEIKDGCMCGQSLTLVSPTCCCDYTYLSGGSWYFHDPLGNTTPYVKRLAQGEANTGATVVLCGWCASPTVQVGIKQLLSYNANYSVNCQLWCVSADTPTWFCTSASCYGYCFNVHATLVKSAGIYGECILDVGESCSVFTHSDAICTTVKSKFGFYCYNSACSTCYGYGIHCYYIKYKCCCIGCAWTCCLACYVQHHASTAEATACCYSCSTIVFPSTGCWEVQQVGICTVWCLTTLNPITTCGCCRLLCVPVCMNAYNSASGVDTTVTASINCCVGVNITGTAPLCIYCSYICYCWCGCVYSDGAWSAQHCTYRYFVVCGCCKGAGGTGLGWWCQAWNDNCCMDLTSQGSTSFTCAYMCACAWASSSPFYPGNGDSVGAEACACEQTFGGYICHCYCNVPANSVNCYSHLYSSTDYSACATILDPDGILNYIAVGYN